MAGRGCGSCRSVWSSLSAACVPDRAGARARCSPPGALVALFGVLVSGFAIGATGWSFDWLTRVFGALAAGQPGIGLGGALTLLALLMLLGAGVARLGWVRGDAFTASAIVVCSALLLLFVALPVARSLAGAFVDEAGRLARRAGRPASATSAPGASAAWPAACAAASPGTRSSSPC